MHQVKSFKCNLHSDIAMALYKPPELYDIIFPGVDCLGRKKKKEKRIKKQLEIRSLWHSYPDFFCDFFGRNRTRRSFVKFTMLIPDGIFVFHHPIVLYLYRFIRD